VDLLALSLLEESEKASYIKYERVHFGQRDSWQLGTFKNNLMVLAATSRCFTTGFFWGLASSLVSFYF